MTTNKPGTVSQQPLYGCTSCYEECTYPADHLHVHDGECWCDVCWDERRWDFPGQPCWNDLEPYTPALQAECERLRKDAERYGWLRNQCGTMGNLTIAKVTSWELEGWSGDDPDSAIDKAMGKGDIK